MDTKKNILSAVSALSMAPVGEAIGEGKDRPSPEEMEGAWKEVVEQYGEPDEVIVVDATRGGETEGVVLAYDLGGQDNGGFLLYEGLVIDKRSVESVTFNNAAIPYVENAYQIILTTTSDSHPQVFIPVGRDVHWTREVLAQIERCIYKNS